MIFVTAGAYDLPFDRLVRAVDDLCITEGLDEPIFAQIGHSMEPAQEIEYARFLPLDKMYDYADKARIIISQGGPGSIMLALARGKIPIVVPRQHSFGEMVDNHQVLFAEKLVAERKILLVMDTACLPDMVLNYDDKIADLSISARDIQQKAETFSTRVEETILSYQKKKRA